MNNDIIQYVESSLSNVNDENKLHFLIYKITNIETSQYYIGQHTTKNAIDTYSGSGRYLQNAIQKYGLSAFRKEILFDFDNFEDMNNKEIELVQLSNCWPNNKLSYNLIEGGYNFQSGRKLPQYIKDKISNANSGRPSPFKGKKMSKLERQENYNKLLKLGTISRISKRLLGNSITKGLIWVNNGIKNKLVKPTEIPNGYSRGILYKDKTMSFKSKANKNRIWVNNGIKSKLVDKDKIPNGFVLGRIPTGFIKSK